MNTRVITLLVAAIIAFTIGVLSFQYASKASLYASAIKAITQASSAPSKVYSSLESFTLPDDEEFLKKAVDAIVVERKCEKGPIECAMAQVTYKLRKSDYETVVKEAKVNLKVRTSWELAKTYTKLMESVGDNPEEIYNNIFRYGKYMSGIGGMIAPPVALAKLAYEGKLEKIPVLKNMQEDIEILKKGYEILKSKEMKQDEKVKKLREMKFAEKVLEVTEKILSIDASIEAWKENPSPNRPY